MNYSNSTNISMALAVFLATDDYDHETGTISVTSLMKSTRQLVLSQRVPQGDAITDISDLVASRIGTVIHTGIENSWSSPQLPNVLKELGYPRRIRENIVVNPTVGDREANPNLIPVYQEQRSYLDIDGYTISGKFDFVIGSQVEDFKTTSVWNYMNQTTQANHIIQLSMYRLLNPEIITKPFGTIHFIFTDFSVASQRTTKGYPTGRVISQEYPLMSLEQTEKWAKSKLAAFTKYKDAPQEEIPLCTPSELWQKDSVWKYYKNPLKTQRSTRTFNNQSDALIALSDDGHVGIVKEVQGQAVHCKYCNAFNICKQAEQLIAEGVLVI